MSNKVVSRVKRCLPAVANIANEILDLLEKELNGENIKASVSKSGDKIIIKVNVPGVNKDDLGFNFKRDSFEITFKNTSSASN